MRSRLLRVVILKVAIEISNMGPGTVAHVYNPRYSGSGDRSIVVKDHPEKSMRP
jgi:hypothetical protein